LPIAKEDLIIDAPYLLRPWQRVLSWILTTLGWLLWLYLWLPGLGALLRKLTGYAMLPVETSAARMIQSLEVLKGYVLVGLLLGGLLVLWSRINYWRFQGVERRSFIPDAAADEIAECAGLSLPLLYKGQQGQVLEVYHHDDGEISGVEVQSSPAAD